MLNLWVHTTQNMSVITAAWCMVLTGRAWDEQEWQLPLMLAKGVHWVKGLTSFVSVSFYDTKRWALTDL